MCKLYKRVAFLTLKNKTILLFLWFDLFLPLICFLEIGIEELMVIQTKICLSVLDIRK